jgi:phosphonate transport system substrate-binding protein
MLTLTFTSCMAPRADAFCAALTRYIGDQLQIATAFVGDIAWQERERRFDAGAIDCCWICGLPYVRRADRGQPALELLAAPVMLGQRYLARPVYFSDVVVARASRFHTFADLRGARWAYNEPASHSGYNVVRCHLARLGETSGYFGHALEAGAHETSLRLLLAGEIDASAIDTSVLEAEQQRQPEIAERIRVIATFGPSPIPPWIIHRHVPEALRAAVRAVMLDMHHTPYGQRLLAAERMARFVPIDDHFYDAIRQMDQEAVGVSLTTPPEHCDEMMTAEHSE